MEKNQEKKDEILREELDDEEASEDFGGEDFQTRIQLDDDDDSLEEEEEEKLEQEEEKEEEIKEVLAEIRAKDSPRTTRKDLEYEMDEEALLSKGASVEFASDGDMGDIDYETKVIFVNNQKVSIVTQKKN